MSLFFVPTQHPFAGAATRRYHPDQLSHGGRCGRSITGVHSPFDLVFGGPNSTDFDVFDDYYGISDEQRVRHRYATALRRQVEAERERELRRRRIQQEQRRREAEAAALAAAAAAAWQAEQERQQQHALAERRRRHREWEVKQQRRQQEEIRRRQLAAAQEQWEQFASQGIAGALQFASQFLEDIFSNDEEVAEQEKKASTSTTKDVDVQDSENVQEPVGVKDVETQAGDNIQKPVSKDTDMHLDESAAQDPPEVTPQATEPAAQKLVFSYPLPKDQSLRSTIKADDIKVDFDEQSRTIQIRGLWNEEDPSADNHSDASSASSDEEEGGSLRGRKRSRSPKRSRVSDVDESTGEEIVTSAEQDSNTSAVAQGKQAQGTARVQVPDGADVTSLRAELTDDGFQLYL